MVVMIVVAGVAKVCITAADVGESFAAGDPVPCFVVVQTHGSTVALRHRWRVKTLKAPDQEVRTRLGVAVACAVELVKHQANPSEILCH
eukprot:Skav234380  [mRNA]  locus=scaffold2071:233229:234010:+ [translate_table: standard]